MLEACWSLHIFPILVSFFLGETLFILSGYFYPQPLEASVVPLLCLFSHLGQLFPFQQVPLEPSCIDWDSGVQPQGVLNFCANVEGAPFFTKHDFCHPQSFDLSLCRITHIIPICKATLGAGRLPFFSRFFSAAICLFVLHQERPRRGPDSHVFQYDRTYFVGHDSPFHVPLLQSIKRLEPFDCGRAAAWMSRPPPPFLSSASPVKFPISSQAFWRLAPAGAPMRFFDIGGKSWKI